MMKFSFFFGLCFVLGNLKQARTTVLFKSTVLRHFYGFMAPDRFSLPVAVCNSSVKCEHYGAATDNNNRCLCICPTTKPTIGLFNGTWSCINDERIRKKEGMAYTGKKIKKLLIQNVCLLKKFPNLCTIMVAYFERSKHVFEDLRYSTKYNKCKENEFV